MQISYNLYLVVLSFFIATYASYSMLSVSERLINAASKIKWLIAGSLSLGSGIWSMHFIGMLAYEMPMPVTYDFSLTIFSGVIALAASVLAMYLLGWGKLTFKRIVMGGFIIGSGVACMHYIGMEAMNMPARVHYDRSLVALSLFVAVTAASAALWIAHKLASKRHQYHMVYMFVASVVMGIAIAGMHYIGMAAAEYTMIEKALVQIDDFDNTILVWTITIITLLVISTSLISSNNKSEQYLDNTLLLILTITTAVTISVGMSTSLLYNTAFKTTQRHLTKNINELKNIIQAVTEFDKIHSQNDDKDGARGATIGQIKNAHKGHDAQSATDEFLLFEYSKDKKFINFIIKESPYAEIFPDSFSATINKMQVFKNALEGNSGILKINHPLTNKYIFAAYAYIPELNVGVVNSIEVQEIRQPFIKALLYTSVISFFVIIIAAFTVVGINAPMIRSLKEEILRRNKTENELRNMARNLEDIVKDRTVELSNALIFAEEAARSKGEFLANMSHEIRTPMNGVLGMLQLLKDTEMKSDQKDFVNTAYKSAETLLTLLNDILDFSKIEAGKIELEAVDFNLHETIEDVAALLAESAHKKNIELLTRVTSNVPVMIKGDPTRLRQILFNLTSNAIKFTDSGEVLITASLDKHSSDSTTIRFEVSDTGVGIAENAQEKIFEVFKQEDGSTTRKYGGTGLGLAISKKLAQVMGGDISVRSSVGAGSTFFFNIQVAKSLLKSAEHRDHNTLTGINALIVDDNDTNRKILESILSSWGIKHESAEDGLRALNMIDDKTSLNQTYDLVLLDMMMPGLNGLDVANKLKDKKIKSKIIMLTSLTNANIHEESKQAGIYACIHKPVKKSLLLDTIMASLSLGLLESKAIEAKNEQVSKKEHLPILVAEDNIINQKVVAGMLKNLGYDFDVAENGQDCLDKLVNNKYSLILMDCQMPVMDGYAATRAIREGDNSNDILIVAMTANAMEGDRDVCIQSGMDDYISKPINKASLSELLDKWLEK